MTHKDFSEQIAGLYATLMAIEERASRGEVATEAMEDFKSSVDEMRLRLWALLSARSSSDYQAFIERFRIRRTRDMIRLLDDDLSSGKVDLDREELVGLAEAARALASRIGGAPEQAGA